MRFLVIEPDATPDDLAEAIKNLRQRKAVIPSTAAEFQPDIDELLELLFVGLEPA